MPNKSVALAIVLASVLGLLTLIGSGCGEISGTESGVVSTPTPTSTPEVIEEPLSIGIGFDQTDSANSTRTEQPGVEALQPLIDRIKRRGGEIGVTLIRDRSNRPLLRLRIDSPPTEPTKPSDTGNAYEVAKQLDQYDSDHQNYETKHRDWQRVTESRINAFIQNLKPLLAQRANARATDLFNALTRLDLFLAERNQEFAPGLSSRKLILLASDCQDNVGAPRQPLKSGAQVIIVNGVGSLGSLEKMDPTPMQFESLESAIRFISVKKGE